jgi:large subunit ribosomal protein L37Ae
MAEVQKLGSVKRFGARYGRKPKKKLAKIEQELRKKHKCPYCNKPQVKRLAVGIWQCKKCKAKFTGKAYSIKKKIVTEEPIMEKAEEGV